MSEQLKGEQWFRAIKEDYVKSYSYAICQVLQNLYPDEFAKTFGSIENCVREVVDDASVWFEKWRQNYFTGIVARVKSSPTSTSKS